jgi:hypothetical protein
MNNKKIKRTPRGQWQYPHEPTIVPTATGKITMEGLDYPVLGIDELGNSEMMLPGQNYQFPGREVLELPMNNFRNGGRLKKYQNGDKLPPIYVNDKKHPRYQAYQDSLAVYYAGLENFLAVQKEQDERVRRYNQSLNSYNPFNKKGEIVHTDNTDLIGDAPNKFLYTRRDLNKKYWGRDDLMPIKYGSYTAFTEDDRIPGTSLLQSKGNTRYALYKKPRQPILYRKPEENPQPPNPPIPDNKPPLPPQPPVDRPGLDTLGSRTGSALDTLRVSRATLPPPSLPKPQLISTKEGQRYLIRERGTDSILTKKEYFDRYGKYPEDSIRRLGGKLKYQDGGDLKPIYVDDPNDPRIRPYRDSLQSYGYTQKRLKDLKRTGQSPSGLEVNLTSRRYLNPSRGIEELYEDNKKLARLSGRTTTLEEAAKEWYDYDGNVRNVGAYKFNFADGIGSYTVFDYQKPRQPYIYRNPEIVTKQQQLIDAGFDIGEADGIWGSKSKKAWEEYQQSLNNQNNPIPQNTNNTQPLNVIPTENQSPRQNLIVTPDGKHLRVSGDQYNRMLNRGTRATQAINYQDGGDLNYNNFVETLPDNLKYSDPNYNLRGMWKSVGSPNSFEEVKDTRDFPLQEDGFYHGFSADSEGNWLKSKKHPTAWMEYLYGHQLNPENNSKFDVVPNTDGYFGENQLQYMPKKRISKFQSGGNFVQREGAERGGYNAWDAIGSFAYGALQGTVGAIPGVGQALSPLMEAGRRGLQSVAGNTGRIEDDVIAGAGAITGAVGSSAITGNPMGAISGSQDGLQKITNSFDNQAKNLNNLPAFKKGGYMNNRRFFQQGGDMGLTEYEGLPHEQGGIPIPGRGAEVEGGETMIDDYVFSDELKIPGKNKTFAQESKAIKNKYNLRKGDPLSQEMINESLEELMQLQEGLKKEMASEKMNEALELDPTLLDNMMGGDPSQQMPMQQDMPQDVGMPMGEEMPMGMDMGMPMRHGGILKKYQNGSFLGQNNMRSILDNVPSGFYSGNEVLEQNNMILNNQEDDFATKDLMYEVPSIGNNNLPNPQETTVSSFRPEPIRRIPTDFPTNLSEFLDDEMPQINARSINKRVNKLPTNTDYGQVRNINIPGYDSPTNSDITLSEYEQDMGLMRGVQGLNALSPIANFIAAGAARGPRLTRNQEFMPTSSRPAEMLLESSNNRALATGRDSIRSASPNQQNFLANTTAATSKASEDVGKGVAELRYRNELDNVNQRRAVDALNIQNQTANNLLLDSSDAQRWNLALQGVEGLQKGTQRGLMDEMMLDHDLLKIGLSEQPNYKYDIRKDKGKRRISKTYKNTRVKN